VTLEASDSLDILQLVARADACATARDAEGYVALFTEDAVMEGDMGNISGRDALAVAVARIWDGEAPGTLHLTLNAVIEESGAEPSVASIMLLLTPLSPSPVAGTAKVHQSVRRTPSGWRISSRTIETTPARRGGAAK
jgi:ketosteroid isomerase-like protein